MEDIWNSRLSENEIKKKLQGWARNGRSVLYAKEGQTNTYEEMSDEIDRDISFTRRAVSLHSLGNGEDGRVVIVAITHGEVIDSILQNQPDTDFNLRENGEEVTYGGIVKL